MNPDKKPVPDNGQDEPEEQQRQGSTAAEVSTPAPLEDLAVLAPIERNYFMRISRQEQATSVRQPANWRARPQQAAKRSGKARGSAVQMGAAAATSGAFTSSAAPTSSASTTEGAAGTTTTEGAAPSNGFATTPLNAADHEEIPLDGYGSSDDDDFSDFCEYDTMFQEQPNYALVQTWSSYVKRRCAAAGGQRAPLEMGQPAATSGCHMPPTDNWRARSATASTEAASTSSWRRNLDYTHQRRRSRSGHHNPDASGSQEELLRPERQPARRPHHNTRGHHGRQRNQWTNSAYHHPPTLNGAGSPHPEHPGFTNGWIGAPGARAYRQEGFRGFSMIGGFQRTRSFGPSNNRRPPPSADANPGRRGSM
ncbi:uncharacterized protein LOC117894717 [Drosophila subobscura]|uniref:uncharacterized protein LOC117894717 n=1 Tax=Drosophila subobscura TaxID=7241 RepID=UPI00155B1540|nr:uncharacterized protein LOC117894717 [Drosophila subobscura]